MIKEKAMELVAALRSGKYTQTTGALHRVDGSMCCLGVACSLVYNKPTGTENPGCFTYNNSVGTLPPKAIKYFGFNSYDGSRDDSGDIFMNNTHHPSLADANDSGCTFDQIADYIEANWDHL